MHISHQQIPNRIPADLQEFLANIARSLVFLSNLHSRKEWVRRLLSQPSGHTCSVDMHNTKHMCFLEKKFFFSFSKGYRAVTTRVCGILPARRRSQTKLSLSPATGETCTLTAPGIHLCSLVKSLMSPQASPLLANKKIQEENFQSQFLLSCNPSFLPPFQDVRLNLQPDPALGWALHTGIVVPPASSSLGRQNT